MNRPLGFSIFRTSTTPRHLPWGCILVFIQQRHDAGDVFCAVAAAQKCVVAVDAAGEFKQAGVIAQ